MPNNINYNSLLKKVPVQLKVFTLAGSLIFFIFIFQGSIGFNIRDEGLLWYAVQRVSQGEVPILDFISYDPGRYYWSSVIMRVLGDNGVMMLRISVSIFQTIGLFAGLMLLTKTTNNHQSCFLLTSAFIIIIWMFPRHKLFDISLSIFHIINLTYLIVKPTYKRYFYAGVIIGLIAVFGRNHGVYGVIASVGVILWLNLLRHDSPCFLKSITLWGIGVILGYIPVISMILFIPDFDQAFLESILYHFEYKTTNIAIPVPWPWKLFPITVFSLDIIRGVLIGIFYLFLLSFGLFSLCYVLYNKNINSYTSSVLIAGAFLSIPYSHHAFSRPDISHLAQSIFPTLIGILVILSTSSAKMRWLGLLTFSAVSLLIMLPKQPGWKCYISDKCTYVNIATDNILVNPPTARVVKFLVNLSNTFTPNGEMFYVTPFWPGAYPMLGRKAPVRYIYSILPRSESFQKREIKKLISADLNFVLIVNNPPNHRMEYLFKYTQPLVYKYILDNYDNVNEYSNNNHLVFTKRALM